MQGRQFGNVYRNNAAHNSLLRELEKRQNKLINTATSDSTTTIQKKEAIKTLITDNGYTKAMLIKANINPDRVNEVESEIYAKIAPGFNKNHFLGNPNLLSNAEKFAINEIVTQLRANQQLTRSYFAATYPESILDAVDKYLQTDPRLSTLLPRFKGTVGGRRKTRTRKTRTRKTRGRKH